MAVSAAIEILIEFPILVQEKDFCKFVFLLSRNGRAGRRILAVELAGKAVQQGSFFQRYSNNKITAQEIHYLILFV